MIEWPILIVAGLGIDELRRQSEATHEHPDASPSDAGPTHGTQGTADMIDEFDWLHPVPAWNGYQPQTSQGYRPPDHKGVDIMYPRLAGGGVDQAFAAGTSQGTPRWFCPDGIIARAPHAGYVWSAGFGPTGGYVVIDCGAPIAVFMVHFGALLVPETQRGSGHYRLDAGDPIGVISFSPRDGQRLNHLHLEVWRNGGSAAHVDPAPYLRKARR